MKFKKVLSAILASLTLFSVVPAGAAGSGLKEKLKSNRGVICNILAGSAILATAGLVLCTGYVADKINDYQFEIITVGEPGRILKNDDFKKYARKEKATDHGIIPLLSEKNNPLMVDVVRAKNIKVCDGVTSIDDYAFTLCSNTKMIIIPDSVKTISCTFESPYHIKPKISYKGRVYNTPKEFLIKFDGLIGIKDFDEWCYEH